VPDSHDVPATVDDAMTEAVTAQRARISASLATNRAGFTRAAWIADARAQFGAVDGSVLALVNGHVSVLLDSLDQMANQLNEILTMPVWGRVTPEASSWRLATITLLRNTGLFKYLVSTRHHHRWYLQTDGVSLDVLCFGCPRKHTFLGHEQVEVDHLLEVLLSIDTEV
jgi:hypothetical protein